jgi:site-specific DNA-methyltransferase (adenine-specific)
MMQKTLFENETLIEPLNPAFCIGAVSRSTLLFGDCLIESDKIKDGSVDLILTDLPYGIMQPNHNGTAYKKMYKDKLKWDYSIEPSKIFDIANRILRKNGKLLLFSQEPYTSKLITQQIPNIPFNYKMIWDKKTFGSHLKCNNAPLGFFEEIVVFKKQECYEAKHPLRDILEKYVVKYGEPFIINLFKLEGRYSSDLSARVHASHKFGFNTAKRFDLFDKKMFDYLSKHIDFIESYDELKNIHLEYQEKYKSTFNLLYGNKFKSNILEFKKDNTKFHPTQKPILLLEDLIKTFSNENNLVVDLTMGSGSTGVACKNTNRNFIGIEKDENYYNVALRRCS